VQVAEQVALPSHCSPGSRMPLPHTVEAVVVVVLLVMVVVVELEVVVVSQGFGVQP
jgi:hypothetical protein